MSNYFGKTCPYCKTVLTESDEIVVCSACDMPHHKDCWVENQGCTTFGCSGAIKSADGTDSSVTASEMNYDTAEQPRPAEPAEFVFCTQCGARNAAVASFCTQCGNRMGVNPAPTAPAYTSTGSATYTPPTLSGQQSNTYRPPYTQQTGYSHYQQSANVDPDLQALIGPKAEYYIPKFQEMNTQNKQTSWNWPAFLFTAYWMIYRKMYGYGAAVLGAAFVIALIGSPFLSLVAFAGYIVLGIYANRIYQNHLEGQLRQVKSMQEPYRSQFISKNGGVNTTATVLTIIGYGILTGLLTL